MFKPEYVERVDFMGGDLTVCIAARVSFSKQTTWENITDEDGYCIDRVLSERDGKLVNYLAKHGHISPFFHPMITLRIKMPIFVARQWYKSQIGFARNEVSRRYVSDEPEFWIPTEWRMAAKDKKQGSSDEVRTDSELGFTYGFVRNLINESVSVYNCLIDEGVAPEMARMILPQSMMTSFVETASLAAYARLVKLRTTSDAQQEIRDYANRVSEIMAELFPVSWKALMEH